MSYHLSFFLPDKYSESTDFQEKYDEAWVILNFSLIRCIVLPRVELLQTHRYCFSIVVNSHPPVDLNIIDELETGSI